MIPGTQNSETHVTQNEIKTPEIKRPVNNIITSVKYSELLRQENAKECDSNTEITKDRNGDTEDSKAQECGKLFTDNNLNKMEKGYTNNKKKCLGPKRKKPGVYPTEYWVQFTQASNEPMEYTPDRNSFVAKVFSITFVMLFITCCFVAFVVLSPDMRELFLDANIGKMLMFGAAGGMLILNYKVMCSPCVRIFPCNFITLIAAVICMSLIAAYVTARHSTTLIMYAMIATSVTVLVCFLLALTSFDFTKFILYIIVITIVLFVLTTVVFIGQLITGFVFKPVQLIILFIGTILNVIVLIMELQLILGGKTVSLSENDYTLGAFLLYTSIIDLFLKILQLLGFTLDEDGDFFSDLL